jgi:hypothetical protein
MAGLSTADVEQLRTAVTAGRKPKVRFRPSAGQMAGEVGQVIRLDDPATDEWVVVRFGRDELPFAPTDLEIDRTPRKKAVKAVKAAAKKAPDKPATVDQVVVQPSGGTSLAEKTAPEPATNGVAKAVPPAAQKAPDNPPRKAAQKAVRKAADKATPKARKAVRKPGELTVTVHFKDGEWTDQAQRGARVLVKPTPVPAAAALRMVSALETPAVHDVVEEIVEATKAEAEEAAERLRAQLEEVENILADLEDLEH